jgi:hypothetical protein
MQSGGTIRLVAPSAFRGHSSCVCAVTTGSIHSTRALARDAPEPGAAVLDDAPLRREVRVGEPEAAAGPHGPLEVIHERPAEVALHWSTGFDRAQHSREVLSEVVDARGIVDVSVGGDDVIVRGAVLGDI